MTVAFPSPFNPTSTSTVLSAILTVYVPGTFELTLTVTFPGKTLLSTFTTMTLIAFATSNVVFLIIPT